jgi:hypothetical protein
MKGNATDTAHSDKDRALLSTRAMESEYNLGLSGEDTWHWQS